MTTVFETINETFTSTFEAVNLNGYATETYVDDVLAGLNAPDMASFATIVYVDNAVAGVSGGTVDISGKVDKVTGKSLISDTEITRLASVNNYNDTAITASLANKVDKVTGKSLISDSEITRLSGVSNVDISGKVDKVTGYSLTKNDFTDILKSKLDSITEIFTTALKSSYDSAVSWISTNGTNLLNHLSNTSNPHSVTKTQIGLGSVPNTDFTSAVAANTAKVSFDSTSSTRLANTSGTNTGDETTLSIQTKRPLKTINGNALDGSGDIAISGGSVDTSTLALNTGTTLWHSLASTSGSVGTFNNTGTSCTGTGTAITPLMVGAKITKANGEIGYITARISNTSFTVSGFTTNSVGTTFSLYNRQTSVASDGSINMYNFNDGYSRFSISADGTVSNNGNHTQSNGNTNINGFNLSIQGVAELNGYGFIMGNFFRSKTIYTVETLPNPSIYGVEYGAGIYATVSNALAPSYLSTVVGGGSVICPVFWNGTNWVCH